MMLWLTWVVRGKLFDSAITTQLTAYTAISITRSFSRMDNKGGSGGWDLGCLCGMQWGNDGAFPEGTGDYIYYTCADNAFANDLLPLVILKIIRRIYCNVYVFKTAGMRSSPVNLAISQSPAHSGSFSNMGIKMFASYPTT